MEKMDKKLISLTELDACLMQEKLSFMKFNPEQNSLLGEPVDDEIYGLYLFTIISWSTRGLIKRQLTIHACGTR